MRSIAIVIVLAFGTALAVWAATPAAKSTTSGAKKTGAKKTAAKKTTAKKSTAKSSKSAPKTSTKKRTTAKTAASSYRRSTQREPAPERYKEIQQSLADKGYFGGPVNGTWNSDSVDALKRFQRDQHIGDDGKLGSLSLIALGLGPKRGASSAENPGAGLPPP